MYYDNARVPKANLVGELNKGWTIAKALLGFERLAIGSPRRPGYALRRLEMVARARGLFEDQGFLDRYTKLKLDIEDLGSLYGRFVEQVKRGEQVGPDVSMLKIWAMESWQRLSELLLEIGDNIGIIPGTTICGLADGAAWRMKNAIRKFRDEFEEYIRRTNPTGYQETSAVPAIDLVGIH